MPDERALTLRTIILSRAASEIVFTSRDMMTDESVQNVFRLLQPGGTPPYRGDEVRAAIETLVAARLLKPVGEGFRITASGRRQIPRGVGGRGFWFAKFFPFAWSAAQKTVVGQELLRQLVLLDSPVRGIEAIATAAGPEDIRVGTGRQHPNVVFGGDLTIDAPVRGSEGPAGAAAPEECQAGADPQHGDVVYALIDVPPSVTAGAEVQLTVGISGRPQPNVVGGELTIDAPAYPYSLTLFVAADRFTLRDGESWLNVLSVTGPNDFPTTTLHLTPQDVPAVEDQRTIAVFYSVSARTVGFGAVTVTVRPPGAPDAATPPFPPATATVTAIGSARTPDLTIRVLQLDSAQGRLSWSFESPHLSPNIAPIETTIGSQGLSFATALVELVDGADEDTVEALMRGLGGKINGAMPPEFDATWDQLHAVLRGAVPSVQILSEEPYVPWELASVKPHFDDDSPAFLAAQADVGRWVLGRKGRPPVPPPQGLDFKPLAAVTTIYDGPVAERLPYAEEEGNELIKRYGASPVEAAPAVVQRCIQGDPPANVVHFALHGMFDANPAYRGLLMNDGHVLNAPTIEGFIATRRPFVFLNACQVGEGAEMLGNNAGIAAAFLTAGARGVVAPLWSVKDDVAKEIALRFYEALLTGASPAEIMRSERKRFKADPKTSTYLAYLFFGDPHLRYVEPAATALGTP